MLAATSIDLFFTSDIITFDPNWHHLYSCSAGGKNLSTDTQIRVISSVEPGISIKMLTCRNLSGKLRAKLPATTYGYSMVEFACLDDAFSDFFQLVTSLVEGQWLQQKEKKRRKWKGAKPKDDFCACPSRNVVNVVLVWRYAYCDVADAFLSRSELIWLISRLKISKMCKKCKEITTVKDIWISGLN